MRVVRVLLDVSIADGGVPAVELLEAVCARARMQRGVRILAGRATEVEDDDYDDGDPEAC